MPTKTVNKQSVPLKAKTKYERSLVKEADHIVNSDRPDRYGPVEESFIKVAKMATLMMTPSQLACGYITPQMVCIVLRAIKNVRDTYSPDNPDHLRDSCGYTELQDQLRQLGIE